MFGAALRRGKLRLVETQPGRQARPRPPAASAPSDPCDRPVSAVRRSRVWPRSQPFPGRPPNYGQAMTEDFGRRRPPLSGRRIRTTARPTRSPFGLIRARAAQRRAGRSSVRSRVRPPARRSAATALLKTDRSTRTVCGRSNGVVAVRADGGPLTHQPAAAQHADAGAGGSVVVFPHSGARLSDTGACHAPPQRASPTAAHDGVDVACCLRSCRNTLGILLSENSSQHLFP